MEDFALAHRRYVNSGQRIGIIDDKAYAVNNIYVIRAHHHFPTTTSTNMMPSHKYQIPKSSNYQLPESRPWYSTPELKRKKRVAKYKIYSMEGKVKKSFKNGYRWFKHTCSRIIHGF
ncbi:hypothetical protein A4A49_41260 [Nicotiana attenuata]|uniref:Uncharacterized protein n=1 Tax=Nicotiana attenuata TaxID=49451 RepID=A0A314L3L1_NICAT|nr:hypothetical protein A4A49_41260 [Nicotiana attenuata]